MPKLGVAMGLVSPAGDRRVVAPVPDRVQGRLPVAAIVTGFGVLVVWEVAVRVFAVPAFLLPPPSRIVATLVTRWPVIWQDALVTFGEMVVGLLIGAGAGALAAIVMAGSRSVERSVGPLLVVAQALPVFALAPLLVVWLGFGLPSKFAMAALVNFFPVTTTFFEGLRRTDPGLIDLGRLNGASRGQMLIAIRIPAALPALGAGLRVAAAGAPLGAIVGEWVGASQGLGLMMLQANARMQTDMVFAGLTILVVFAVGLWAATGALTRRLIHWAPDTLSPLAGES